MTSSWSAAASSARNASSAPRYAASRSSSALSTGGGASKRAMPLRPPSQLTSAYSAARNSASGDDWANVSSPAIWRSWIRYACSKRWRLSAALSSATTARLRRSLLARGTPGGGTGRMFRRPRSGARGSGMRAASGGGFPRHCPARQPYAPGGPCCVRERCGGGGATRCPVRVVQSSATRVAARPSRRVASAPLRGRDLGARTRSAHDLPPREAILGHERKVCLAADECREHLVECIRKHL